MISVLTALYSWTRTLPAWEQAALAKVLDGETLVESDYDDLLRYLLEEHGLAPKDGVTLPQLRFSEKANTPIRPSLGPTWLMRIFNTRNANALVADQTITFTDGMTAIYGQNGSGKSGYARLLGCACFTRGDKEVLPDINRVDCPNLTASMDVELGLADGTTRIIHFQPGSYCPELASFYMFDSTSVLSHLTKSNKISFAPAGLVYLTRLADVTDKVRERLQDKIGQNSRPHSFRTLFQGQSSITQVIDALGPTTRTSDLRELSVLTHEDERQRTEIEIQIARLKAEDIPRQVAAYDQTIHDLARLTDKLRTLEAQLDDQSLDDLNDGVAQYLKFETIAQTASLEQFQSEHFTFTGSDAWRRFIEAAKALADAESRQRGQYPQASDHCLLCQQPLSSDARDLLGRLWEYLQAEAQAQLDTAQRLLDSRRRALERIDLDFFNDQAVAHRFLLDHRPGVLEKVDLFVAACRLRHMAALELIRTFVLDARELLPASGVADLEALIHELQAQRDDLQQKNTTTLAQDLQQQLVEFEHRETLAVHLPAIEEYVRQRQWAQQASKVGSNTRHITKKHNELFTALVTDRYIELFEQTLADMQRPLRVKIRTTSRKGETLKQIVLEVDPSVQTNVAVPEKILSEGEKRAVALADFLTEVALDETSCGIILDDPVTSLDQEWKDTIADRLVSEASRRQVVVFTHDLPFLSLLKTKTESQQMPITMHWIKRGDEDGLPGYVYLDNGPTMERTYKTTGRAQQFYERAKVALPEEQEMLLKAGFGALRSTYEAFVIYEVFGGVVERFAERISSSRLREIVFDRSILHEVDEKIGQLSRYIEGHLHSDQFMAQKPTPRTLLDEINAFTVLHKRLRDLKRESKLQDLPH